MLKFLTFTGVDYLTDMKRLFDISERYRDIEWGVLVNKDKTGTRYAEADVRHRLINQPLPNETRIALHMCGPTLHNRILYSPKIPSEVLDYCANFDRVQFNIGHRLYPPSERRRLSRFARQLNKRDTILVMQHRSSWLRIPFKTDGIEYLYDRSGGKGIQNYTKWPFPRVMDHMPRYFGYAGGIGPDTIDQVLAITRKYPLPYWLDMETRVRTDNVFDLDKVEEVCRKVWPDR